MNGPLVANRIRLLNIERLSIEALVLPSISRSFDGRVLLIGECSTEMPTCTPSVKKSLPVSLPGGFACEIRRLLAGKPHGKRC